jgi:mycothiol synthase
VSCGLRPLPGDSAEWDPGTVRAVARPTALTAIDPAELGSICELMTACVDLDGGLPAATEPSFVSRVFLHGPGVGARDSTGALIAAVALGEPLQGLVPVSGAVHPSHRGRGIGESLLRWAIREAGGDPVQLRSESVTEEFEHLVAQLGFTQVFGELIMRRPSALSSASNVAEDVTRRSWAPDTVDAFFEAYGHSFADRRGFPGWTKRQWVEHETSDDDFRPDDSVVVFDLGGNPIGFVLIAGDWIVQLGVVPAWRRRGIGGDLLRQAIDAIRGSGSEAVWLNVNVDNEAALSLYEAAGFSRFGRRGRFERVGGAQERRS